MNVTCKVEKPRNEAVVGSCCPACESVEGVESRPNQGDGYRVRQCAGCALVYSDPMRSADANWYSSSWLYGLRESHRGRASGDSDVPWNFAQGLAELRAAARGRLLDVGCGEGYFLHLAQQAGYEVTGLDFNPVSVAIAQERLGVATVHRSSVEEVGDRFSGTQFDVVTIFEVLEHTADPYQTLRCIYGLLKQGGKLLLSVPGSRRWPPLFDPESDAPPHHLTLWTEEALRRLLGRAGFRVHEVRTKPLVVQDLGLHLKWLWHRMMRRRRDNRESRPARQEIPPGAPRGALGFRPSDRVRKLGTVGLAPLCWALRRNPRAGGFTLFALGEKQ